MALIEVLKTDLGKPRLNSLVESVIGNYQKANDADLKKLQKKVFWEMLEYRLSELESDQAELISVDKNIGINLVEFYMYLIDLLIEAQSKCYLDNWKELLAEDSRRSKLLARNVSTSQINCELIETKECLIKAINHILKKKEPLYTKPKGFKEPSIYFRLDTYYRQLQKTKSA